MSDQVDGITGANVVTLGEVRAIKNGDCRDWTVREAMLSMIRDIDAGKLKVDRIIMVFDRTEKDSHGEEAHGLSFRLAGDFPPYVLLGMLETFKLTYVKDIG